MSQDIIKTGATTEEKLDEIILHLKHLDKRDRTRMIWSTVKSVLTLIPLFLLLGSSWYFITHWDDLLKQITSMAASSAAEYTTDKSQGLFEQIMKQYGIPRQNESN